MVQVRDTITKGFRRQVRVRVRANKMHKTLVATPAINNVFLQLAGCFYQIF